MDRLQLDKNAKLTGRVYFKDEIMLLGLSGSGASFTFDGTKLVLKLKGDNIAVGNNPIDYARIAVYVDGKRVIDEIIDCAEKEVTVIDRTENAQSVVEIIKLSESPMSAVLQAHQKQTAHQRQKQAQPLTSQLLQKQAQPQISRILSQRSIQRRYRARALLST